MKKYFAVLLSLVLMSSSAISALHAEEAPQETEETEEAEMISEDADAEAEAEAEAETEEVLAEVAAEEEDEILGADGSAYLSKLNAAGTGYIAWYNPEFGKGEPRTKWEWFSTVNIPRVDASKPVVSLGYDDDENTHEDEAIGAFSNQTAHTRIDIEDGILRIGSYAFNGASNLKTVFIPKTIEYIGHEAFEGCSSALEIRYQGSEEDWKKIRIAEDNPALASVKMKYNCKHTSIELDQKELRLKVGETAKLTATLYSDDPEDLEFRWFFPGKTVDVDKDGNVTAKQEGIAYVHAYSENAGMSASCTVYVGDDAGTMKMYRLYNPNSGEHFYTGRETEKNNLVHQGWKDEGVGFKALVSGGIPMYRLYNPNAGDHHYTKSEKEKDSLVAVGWKYEGIGWNAADSTGIPMYRLYNPNATGAGSHHYTKSEKEKDILVAAGWKYEGIGFYAGK